MVCVLCGIGVICDRIDPSSNGVILVLLFSGERKNADGGEQVSGRRCYTFREQQKSRTINKHSTTMATKFYKCNRCGNVVMKMVDSGVVPVCCGEEMHLLVANTHDASTEKHVPVATRIDEHLISVQVGSGQCAPPHAGAAPHFVHLCRDRARRRSLRPER